MQIQMIGKLKKIGNSYMFLIPKDLIKCNVIDISEPITLELKEQKQKLKVIFYIFGAQPF